MPVRNAQKAGKPGNYPVSYGAGFTKPPHNPEPTTARGRRRKANTPEYQKNLSQRQSQSGQHGKTVAEKRGPTKIPAKDSRSGTHQKFIQENGR